MLHYWTTLQVITKAFLAFESQSTSLCVFLPTYIILSALTFRSHLRPHCDPKPHIPTLHLKVGMDLETRRLFDTSASRTHLSRLLWQMAAMHLETQWVFQKTHTLLAQHHLISCKSHPHNIVSHKPLLHTPPLCANQISHRHTCVIHRPLCARMESQICW